MSLKKSGYRYKQKKEKCFSLSEHQLSENYILVFGFYERTSKE